jgi:hypothetical protein
MMTAAIIAGLVSGMLYIHTLAKVAARAWFDERERYQSRFIHHLQKDNS